MTMFRKFTVFSLILLMLCAVSVSLVNAADIGFILRQLKNAKKELEITLGEYVEKYDQAITQRSYHESRRDYHDKKLTELEPNVDYLYDYWYLMFEWVQKARNAKDAAQSRIDYANDMLDSLGNRSYESGSYIPQAIEFWKAEKKSAIKDKESAEKDIKTLKPQETVAWHDYLSAANRYNEHVIQYNRHALISYGWTLDIIYYAGTIASHYQNVIDMYKDHPVLGDCPQDFIDRQADWADRRDNEGR